ncbi:MvaI/BcnI restriction endonuclease family [Bifidobacterium criceti]|uniref:MvaI/BcnI restriction endonuclease family n=2 Tax=Bifidobacterium criceti TaxID=1960969 RepID=A0A2A2EH34_9BIFI|nr:MvaI/BcnI restriction endonuclease family [Bifidobacterium criceti]
MNGIREAAGDVAPWYDTITLDEVLEKFEAIGAHAVWAKYLVRNNNSKNQIYVAPNVNKLAFLPMGHPVYTPGKSQKPGLNKSKRTRELVRIPLNWTWIDEDGEEYAAPKTAFSYYPQYPEVRLSGMLSGCPAAPSKLFNIEHQGHDEGRILFLGVVGNPDSSDAHIAAIATGKDAPASQEVLGAEEFMPGTLFAVPFSSSVEEIERDSKEHIGKADEFSVLSNALEHIVGYPIIPWRLRNDGTREDPYRSPNAPGLTLEAELGVGENAIPGPDFDIWELKAYKVDDFQKPFSSHRITLFTPQPDFGVITDIGQSAFVETYGHINEKYASRGIERYDFTTKDFNGIGQDDPNAALDLRVFGMDGNSYSMSGSVSLVDRITGVIVAGWSFTKLLGHWQKKHDRAAYIPYCTFGSKEDYCVEYGPNVLLGMGTDFGMFLNAFQEGEIVFDPAFHIKRREDGGWETKSRSQFRIALGNLDSIYESVKEVSVEAR